VKALQQRIVQIACDALALGHALLEPIADPRRYLVAA
jgi:hypothetical protein